MKIIQTGNGKVEIDVEGDIELAQRVYSFLENLTKHAEKSTDFLHQKGNSSSKKDCYTKSGCPAFKDNKCYLYNFNVNTCKDYKHSPS